MSEWQPIEDAPRDGTPILVFDGEEMMVASRNDDELREPWKSGGAWFCCAYDMAGCSPTHWMPLPSPPKAPVERVGG